MSNMIQYRLAYFVYLHENSLTQCERWPVQLHVLYSAVINAYLSMSHFFSEFIFLISTGQCYQCLWVSFSMKKRACWFHLMGGLQRPLFLTMGGTLGLVTK